MKVRINFIFNKILYTVYFTLNILWEKRRRKNNTYFLRVKKKLIQKIVLASNTRIWAQLNLELNLAEITQTPWYHDFGVDRGTCRT